MTISLASSLRRMASTRWRLRRPRAGRKRSHWMWFILPQIAGLGSEPRWPSNTRSVIAARRERTLEHAVLGPRLVECTETLLALNGLTAAEVFGHPDDCSLLELHALRRDFSQPGSVFDRLLAKYYDGIRDPLTLERLAQSNTDRWQIPHRSGMV